jgi:hypothetical protein
LGPAPEKSNGLRQRRQALSEGKRELLVRNEEVRGSIPLGSTI